MKFVMNVDLSCLDGVVRSAGQEVPASCVTDYMLLNGLASEVVEEVVEEQPLTEVVEEQPLTEVVEEQPLTEVVEEQPLTEVVEEVVEEQLLTEVSEPVEVEVEETKPTRKKGRGRR